MMIILYEMMQNYSLRERRAFGVTSQLIGDTFFGFSICPRQAERAPVFFISIEMEWHPPSETVCAICQSVCRCVSLMQLMIHSTRIFPVAWPGMCLCTCRQVNRIQSSSSTIDQRDVSLSSGLLEVVDDSICPLRPYGPLSIAIHT